MSISDQNLYSEGIPRSLSSPGYAELLRVFFPDLFKPLRIVGGRLSDHASRKGFIAISKPGTRGRSTGFETRSSIFNLSVAHAEN